MSRMSSLILLFLVACTHNDQDSAPLTWSMAQLWTLTEINGTAIDAPEPALLRFSSKDQSITGSTGCNRLFGSYTHEDGRFAVEKVGTTKRYCGGPQGELEQRLLEQLQSADRIRLVDDQLLISGPAGSLTLIPGGNDAR